MAQTAVDIVVRTKGQQELDKLQQGLTKTQQQFEALQGKAQKQGATTAQLAGQLRRLKGEYEQLTAAAKASAKAGGEGFSQETISRLRGLTTEIDRTKQAFLESKSATANYKQQLAAASAGAKGVGASSVAAAGVLR